MGRALPRRASGDGFHSCFLAVHQALLADEPEVMVTIASLVTSLGGMAQKQQLVALGARDHDLTRAVRRQEVVRARQGWYSTMPENSLELRAVRVGGRLTGMSALTALGAWHLGEFPLHVSVHDNAARLRTQWNRFHRLDPSNARGVILHWDDADVAGRGTAVSVGLSDALLRVILDESIENAVAAVDWARSTGALDRIDFELLMLRVPQRLRFIGGLSDENCGSLPESIGKTRLVLRGHRVVSQVPIARAQRIDLVIDDVVGLEIDGEEFHVLRFAKDRNKDIDITLVHLHAMRPTAQMVFHDWERVLAAIETAIADRTGSPFGKSGNGKAGSFRSPGTVGLPDGQ